MRRRRKTHRRGRTRPDRLALLDGLFERGGLSLPGTENIVADIGFGESPTTTVRWHQALLPFDPSLKTVGVEIDPGRVENARRELDKIKRREKGNPDLVSFRSGGFDFWTAKMPRMSVVRCMNVLRGYGMDDQLQAKRAMMQGLRIGGLLIEGTSDTEGHLLACHVYERLEDTAKYRALILATDFARGFSPWMFRDVLPRDLRRHVHQGEPIWSLLSTWDEIVAGRRVADESTQSNARMYEKSLCLLEETRSDLSIAREQWAHGCVFFAPHPVSPRPEVLQTGAPLDIVEP